MHVAAYAICIYGQDSESSWPWSFLVRLRHVRLMFLLIQESMALLVQCFWDRDWDIRTSIAILLVSFKKILSFNRVYARPQKTMYFLCVRRPHSWLYNVTRQVLDLSWHMFVILQLPIILSNIPDEAFAMCSTFLQVIILWLAKCRTGRSWQHHVSQLWLPVLLQERIDLKGQESPSRIVRHVSNVIDIF